MLITNTQNIPDGDLQLDTLSSAQTANVEDHEQDVQITAPDSFIVSGQRTEEGETISNNSQSDPNQVTQSENVSQTGIQVLQIQNDERLENLLAEFRGTLYCCKCRTNGRSYNLFRKF